LPVLV